MIIFLLFLLLWIGLSFRYSYVVFAILAVVLFVLTFRKYKWKISLLGLFVFSLGIGISYIRIDIKSDTYAGMVMESKNNYFILLSKGERLYVYQRDNPYEIGDYLSIKGEKEKVNFAKLESQFDFSSYLERKGIIYELNPSQITYSFQNPIHIRANKNTFLTQFDIKTRQVVGSLLFSDYDSSEVLDNIETLHLSRLVNMSGVYIYVFLSIIEFFLSFFLKPKWSKLAAHGVLLPYYIFTFPRFTIIRIFALQILRWINKYPLKDKFSSLDVLGIGGLFFLLIDYHLGYQDSFIIGFTLPAMITFSREGIVGIKGMKKKIVEALFAYLVVLPFEIKYYQGINPMMLPSQYLFMPLFVLFAIASMLCFYKIPIYGVAKFFLTPIDTIASAFKKLSFSINVPSFPSWLILIYGVLLIAIYYYRGIGFIPIYRTLEISLFSFLTLYSFPLQNFISESVTFINVGQGDCCLIRKADKSILIDTGGLTYMDLAKECLVPYIRSQRIYDIDLVITTHDDYDHSGALDSLKENFYVKDVINEASKFPINIGGITFNNYNTHIAEYSDENEKSLVIGFNLVHKDFLIMGDAPTEVEKNIIKEFPNLQCDILKLGHHGSKTSTCDEFIKFTNPEVAIISCGLNNKYGHPNKEVISILNRNHIHYRRTDFEGSIHFSNYIFM